MKKMIAVAAMCLMLAGCSTAATPKPHPTFKTTFGSSASTIASHVDKCNGVAAGDIAKGGPALASTATCVLLGHTVVINSWATQSDEDDLDAILAADKSEVYYAKGNGWTAIIGDDPTLQLQLTNQAGELLQRQLDGKTPRPIDVSGSHDIAKAVVASIGGTIAHYAP